MINEIVTLVSLFTFIVTAHGIENYCNTGTAYCCNALQDTRGPRSQGLLSMLGLDLGVATSAIAGQVGINCSPLSVIGIGEISCVTQTVCCTGNSFNGVVVGCSPLVAHV